MAQFLPVIILPPEEELQLPILPLILEDEDIPSSEEDNDDYEPPRIRVRRAPVFRERYNYFENLSDEHFKLRFRLEKNTVLWILEKIVGKIEPKLNRYVK